MNSSVDLRQLAMRRDGPAIPAPVQRRHVMTRYVLPGLILLGFLSVAGWAARDSLMSSKPVTVVPVVATRSEVQEAGTPLFQSAGWVEPRPTPVLATALAEGVVERLLVVEGQEVREGQPVALLIEDDARLVLRAAQAELHWREAELASARAGAAAAKINLRQPLSLQAALAEAETLLAKIETDQAVLPYQIRAAEARQKKAQESYEANSGVANSAAIPALIVRLAESERDMTAAQSEELKARKPRLEKEVGAHKNRRDALRLRLDLKTDEVRQLADTEAAVKSAQARCQQAQVAVDRAELCMKRMTVRAPIKGRVLTLLARPGMRVMGLTPGSMHDASTVVSLYDPASLQVRADVRLDDVPHVLPGQPVRIETAAVTGEPLEGEVLFATSQADIQKNTLQVKVSIKNPPAVLKPDMLVQVTFLAPPSTEAAPPGSERLRLFVPRSLVENGEGGTAVWIADRVAGVAHRRSVKLGMGMAGDLVEIVEGLTPADKLITGGREGLREGERIKITGEEESGSTGYSSSGKTASRLPRSSGNKGDHQGKH